MLSLFLIILMLFSLTNPTPKALAISPKPLPIDKIFQFDDSLSDTGNLARENPIASHVYMTYPYGQTIHHPSGRCSDGLLIVDHIANFFHLPFLKPYLDRQANFTYGVNFAVAGSTALDTSALIRFRVVASPMTNSSLSVQLNWFKSHLSDICEDNLHYKRSIVSRSLVIMGEIGGNDFNYAFFKRMPMQELRRMVPKVVKTIIKEAVLQVIKLGTTRIMVPGNFPIGCLPVYLTLFQTHDSKMYDEFNCLKWLNEFARFYNGHLQAAIGDLQRENPNVSIVYGDYFGGLRWIIQNAGSFGFNEHELQRVCCGIGENKYNFNLTRMSGSVGSTVCRNPNERYSWDGIHLTQHAFYYMAKWLLHAIVSGIGSHV